MPAWSPCRFDVSKPWSLGVFLTCQVRLEQPDSKKQQQQPLTGTAAAAAPAPAAAAAAIIAQAAAAVTAVGGDTVAAGATRRLSSGSNGSSGLVAGGTSDSNSRVVQQQQQLVMQLVDFGFVSTSATIAVREAGGSKRMEKSWEHAVVGGGGHVPMAAQGLVVMRSFACCMQPGKPLPHYQIPMSQGPIQPGQHRLHPFVSCWSVGLVA